MKALVYDRYGSPDFLEVREVGKPVPKRHEVLVRVHAVSINDWDWGLILGKPFVPNRLMAGLLKPRFIIGCDIAGRVEAVGQDVQRFQRGDDVYGDLCGSGFGGFAEFVCARERALERKPARMTFAQAAAIPQAAMLALQGLFDARPLRAGMRILINGAGGGVGTFAIQLIRARRLPGIDVTGVDSAEKLDLLRSMGYDRVVDFKTQDFTATGLRYDLILDAKTTRAASDCARALNPDGLYATVGGPRLLGVTMLGFWRWRASRKKLFLVALKPNRDLCYLNELFEAGQLAPVIDGPYPLNEVRDAFRLFGAGRHKGKVVITIAEEAGPA